MHGTKIAVRTWVLVLLLSAALVEDAAAV
jgi:hypothetical protein